MSLTPAILCSLAVCSAEAGSPPPATQPPLSDTPKLEQVMTQTPKGVSANATKIANPRLDSAGIPEATVAPGFSPSPKPPPKPVTTVDLSSPAPDQQIPGSVETASQPLTSPEFIDNSELVAENASVNGTDHSEEVAHAGNLPNHLTANSQPSPDANIAPQISLEENNLRPETIEVSNHAVAVPIQNAIPDHEAGDTPSSAAEISAHELPLKASSEQSSDFAASEPTAPIIANGLPGEEASNFETDPFWELPTGTEADSPETPEDSTEEASEEDIGDVRILSPTPQRDPQPPPPIAHLVVRASAFTSSNISGLNQPSPSDVPLTTSAGVRFTPALGPETHLVASAEAGITRFPEAGASNSDAIELNVGVHQRLGARTAAQIGWENRQLFRAGSGEQLLDQNSVNVTLGRQDPLDENLRLNSFYRLKAQFAHPIDRSRLSHTLGVNLHYDVAPDVDLALGYQLQLDDYTQQVRFDTIHQIRTAVTYQINRDVFLTGLASYQFGSSSDATINPENLSFGLGLGLNLPLF